MLAALTNRSPVTGDALPRAARLHAVAGHERHLFGELSPPWWSAPFAINILLFTTEINQFIPFSPPGNYSYELKITFCVRGGPPNPAESLPLSPTTGLLPISPPSTISGSGVGCGCRPRGALRTLRPIRATNYR